MKTKLKLTTLFILLCPFFCKCQRFAYWNNLDKFNFNIIQKNESSKHESVNLTGKSFWGELNAGYSNHGYGGSTGINFRKGKFIYGAHYDKFHICYHDNKKRDYFLNDGNSDQHKTIESISLVSGMLLPGKLTPSLYIGVSWSQFKYENTTCVEHNATLPRIWETIMNRDYTHESLGSHTIQTIGIPVGLKLHFAPKHFAGFEAGIKADLNPHSTMISAEFGIRLGRIARSRPHLNL